MIQNLVIVLFVVVFVVVVAVVDDVDFAFAVEVTESCFVVVELKDVVEIIVVAVVDGVAAVVVDIVELLIVGKSVA
jgi:hypothetical protein